MGGYRAITQTDPSFCQLSLISHMEKTLFVFEVDSYEGKVISIVSIIGAFSSFCRGGGLLVVALFAFGLFAGPLFIDGRRDAMGLPLSPSAFGAFLALGALGVFSSLYSCASPSTVSTLALLLEMES